MSRLGWIDVLKGIGIVSVVAGHIFSGLVQDIIFLFHMPLFFFIGGFLYKNKLEPKEYFWTKFVHLLVPYLVFLTIFQSKELVQLVGNFDKTDFLSVLQLLWSAIVGGRALAGWTGVFWFVTCFFFVQQVFHWMMQKFSLSLIGLICLWMLSASYINSELLPEVWLPLNFNVVFAALPFFFLGFLFKDLHTQKSYYWLGIGLTSLCAFLMLKGVSVSYNMKYADYGIPFISFLGALGAILLIILAAKQLANVSFLSQPLSQLGTASMAIMYVHQPVQLSFQAYLGIEDAIARFVCTLAVSFLIYRLFEQYQVSRALFLGKLKDYMALFRQPVQE